jgi:hypothetical protein
MVIRISMLRFKSSGEIQVLSDLDELELSLSARGIGSEPKLGPEEIAVTDEV